MNKDVLEKMVTLSTTAFGLVAALAWNEAIKTLFANIFGDVSGTISLFVYAVIVTVVAVWVTGKLSRLLEKANLTADKK